MSGALSEREHHHAIDPALTQARASDPTVSVWVNASAGSGKTTILTSRVVRLLLGGVRPERILCLTYTKAGAAEMAIRVTEKLSHWATCGDNELSLSISELQKSPALPAQMKEARKLFAKSLTCPGGMRIRTIHAFCQEILRRFPIEANLPPHFVVMEETDARALQEDVLEDLLREAVKTPDTSSARRLRRLISDLGEKSFRTAMGSCVKERARIDLAGTREAVMARVRNALSLSPNDTIESLMRRAVSEELPKASLRKAAEHLLGGSPSFVEKGQDILAWLDLAPDEQCTHFDRYRRYFVTADGALYKSYANKDIIQRHPDLDSVLRGEGMRLLALDEKREALLLAELTAGVLEIGGALSRRFEAAKRARAALDYDDLIIRTETLLKSEGIAPWILYKLDGGLDHMLVDEAQDTSRSQWNIVAALAEEFFSGRGAKDDMNRTLFVVGDEKQSIFSFQRADPEAFTEMREKFQRQITTSGKIFRPLDLHVSFRSAPAVLNVVDAVFAHENARRGVATEPTAHVAALPQPGERPKVGHVELWPLLASPSKGETTDGVWQLPLGYEEEHDPQAELAARIAEKISGWIKDKTTLPGFDRPIAPGDIMILLRRRRRFADLMVRALKQRSVPVTGVDRMVLIRQLPVMDLLACIQFTLLPDDDLNLATVLRGPLLNLSEEQLMSLAIDRKGTLWQSLKESSDEFQDAKNYLAQWLGEADVITPFAMLARLLNEACPGSNVSGRKAIWSRLGLDALDPIEELLNAAQNFTHSHTPSLQGFLHWLTTSDSEIKRELDHGAAQVRIMTVHASKGLEAPIVFLPDSFATPRPQDVPEFLWTEEGLPLYASSRPSAGLPRRLWEEARERQMEEYRRLMYVALTRAANRLYIGGWETARRDADSDMSWYRLIETALRPLHQSPKENEDTYGPSIIVADSAVSSEKKPIHVLQGKPAHKAPLPSWATEPLPLEPTTPKSIAPSRFTLQPPTATPDSAYKRGRIIHRLMQSLPELMEANREDAAERFLANPQHQLAPPQQKEIKDEVMKLLTDPDVAALFGPGSRAEVSLAGLTLHGKIAGQVDRLCLRGQEVWVVDYKTNRPPPDRPEDVPEAYRLQMASYRDVLRQIYPKNRVRCFLLWTYGPRLMELPTTLDKSLPAH